MKKDLTFHHDEFKQVSEQAKSLCTKFLVKNPDDRIKMDDVLKDPWLVNQNMALNVNFKDHGEVVTKISAFKKANIFTKAIKLCMSKL